MSQQTRDITKYKYRQPVNLNGGGAGANRVRVTRHILAATACVVWAIFGVWAAKLDNRELWSGIRTCTTAFGSIFVFLSWAVVVVVVGNGLFWGIFGGRLCMAWFRREDEICCE